MTVIRFFERRILAALMFLASAIVALISPDMAIRAMDEAMDEYNKRRRQYVKERG